jgi:hypothetical protein
VRLFGDPARAPAPRAAAHPGANGKGSNGSGARVAVDDSRGGVR